MNDHLDNAELAEYNTLRTEILHKIELHNHLITITFTAVIAILAFAANTDDPFLFIIPLAVIIPLSMRISYYRSAISKLSAYIIVYLENHINGLNWESRNSKIVEFAKGNNHIRLVRHECLILSIICYGCYLYCLCHHWSDSYYKNIFAVLWPICLVILETLISFDVKVITKERKSWINIWIDFKVGNGKS